MCQVEGMQARSMGGRFKVVYHGVYKKRDGVGVILKEAFVNSVVEVKKETGNRRGDVACYYCVCLKDWMPVRRYKVILK